MTENGRFEPGDLVLFVGWDGIPHKGVILRCQEGETSALVGYPWRRWDSDVQHIEIPVSKLLYTQDDRPEGVI